MAATDNDSSPALVARSAFPEAYRLLAEHSPDWVSLHDANGVFLASSRTIEQFLGWNESDVVGRQAFEFHHPDDVASVREHLKRSIVRMDSRPIEYRFRHRDGTWVWLETQTRLLAEGHDGKPCVIAMNRDISGRKMAEERLRESEEKFRSVIESSPLGMHFYRLDGEGRLVFTGGNPAAERILGFDHAELIGRTVVEAFPSLASTDIPQRYVEVITKGEVWQREDLAYEDNRIVGAFEVFAFRTSPETMAVTFSEISARKRMEMDLAAEKERLAVTLRSIGDGVIATDLQQRIVILNKVAESMTGWSWEDAIGRPITEVFSIVSALSRKPRENPLARVLETGQVSGLSSHTLLISRDGREYAVADSASPIRDRDSKVIGAVLVFRDVTDKERVDAELARAQKLESLAVLAGGIAHDFNNLLTGIMGNVSLARAGVLTPVESAECLAESEKACMRAQRLTQQLLTFSRGGLPIRKVTSLATLVRETVQFSARGSSLACKFDIPEELTADVDEGQISQVIHNLVLNSAQAIPTGGVFTIRGERVELAGDNRYGLAAGPYARLTLSDDGPGIARDDLARVFDPFYTTKETGQGLGLAICHSIVMRHDGHISVASTQGKGVTFTILLPAAGAGGETAEPRSPENAGVAVARVLVMDDEEQVRTLSARIVKTLGYEVEVAADGKDAIELFQMRRDEGRPFAVVILDLTVPGGMGGREVIQRLREIEPNVRAIVSSGYSSDPILANHARFGFKAVLTKPYRVDNLKSALERVLRD